MTALPQPSHHLAAPALVLAGLLGLSACASDKAEPVATAPSAATEIDAAVRAVLDEQAEPASLFEGDPYAAFTPEDIRAYCQQDWETRISSSGRTEYNPCRRRDAFR